MSIYGTADVFHLEMDDDSLVEVFIQLVPSWVDFECSYLPPPRKDVHEAEGYARPRAAVFTAPWTTKGGDGHGGQEYVNPLLVMSGEEYERANFRETMRRLRNAAAMHLESK